MSRDELAVLDGGKCILQLRGVRPVSYTHLTADIEFAWTREAAGDRGTHLGRHLIQSFAVGETTPEEAHKIGMELALSLIHI